MTPIEMLRQCEALGSSRIEFDASYAYQYGLPRCPGATAPAQANWYLPYPLDGCWMELRDGNLYVVVWDGTERSGCENRGPFDTVEEALQYIYLLQGAT